MIEPAPVLEVQNWIEFSTGIKNIFDRYIDI
jgi:hypothetical protein